MLFFKKKMLPQDKRAEILLVLERYLSNGMNLFNAIDSACKDERDAKIKEALELVLSFVKNGEEIPMAMQKAGIINEREYIVLKYAKSKILIAMKEIVELAKRDDLFVSTLRNTLLVPMLLIPMSLISYYFVDILILKKIKEQYAQIAMLSKKEITVVLDVLYGNSFLLLIIGSSIYVIFTILVLCYRYFYEARTDVVYNYFKLKYFLDAPYILKLMISLNRATGFNLTHVAQELKKYIKPSGLCPLFEKIERSQSHSQVAQKTSQALSLRTVLQQFHFDPAVIRNATIAENRGINEFWKGLESALIFAEDQKNREIKKWQNAGKILIYISMFFGIVAAFSMSGYIYMYAWEIKNALQH